MEKFNFDISYISSKEEQLLKRKLILVILTVFQLLRSGIFFREIQSLNIDFILVILPKFHLDISFEIDFNSVHPSKIEINCFNSGELLLLIIKIDGIDLILSHPEKI